MFGCEDEFAVGANGGGDLKEDSERLPAAGDDWGSCGGRVQVEEETRTEWMAPGRVGSMSLRGVYCGLAGTLPDGSRGEGGGGEWTDA